MNPLQSLAEYELFIYTLQQSYPSIRRSTLVVIRRGTIAAAVLGEIELVQGLRLVVSERLSFLRQPGSIMDYGYEVWQGVKQLYWYDSQPHPDNPTLASTHPHHKHVPPDIKHNLIPAPGLSFKLPNLPFLIEEIEQTLLAHR